MQQNNASRLARSAPMRAIGFDELSNRLGLFAQRNEDFTVKGRDLTFNPDGTLDIASGPRLSWTDLSFSQFCAKLKVPADFIRRSPSGLDWEGKVPPASKKAIIDFWKERVADNEFFVRIRHMNQKDVETGATGFMRGFLTTRYAVLDNLELLNLHRDFIRQYEPKLQVGYVSDKMFHVRMLFPDVVNAGTNEVPDFHQFGTHLRNSEVGACNLQEDFLIFRQICTNGVIALINREHLIDIRHINIDRHQLRMSVASVRDTVLDRHDEIIGRLQLARDVTIANPERELRQFLAANRATEEFLEMAEKAFQREPNNTRFGIIQAITRAAQALPTDARVQMEEAAGKLLLAA
jgi:hypothetical protein